jgi:molybdopterin-guanine dinucleotide biosynthesis protein A
MGRDKSLLLYRGRTLLERAIGLLQSLDLEVQVIGSCREETSPPSTVFREDLIPGLGPMGGVYTALQLSVADAYILACDLPLVTAELFHLLESERDRFDVVVPRNSLGDIQPLCGIYSKHCLPDIKIAIEKGALGLQRLIKGGRLKARLLNVERRGLSDQVLMNVNTQEDYRSLLKAE